MNDTTNNLGETIEDALLGQALTLGDRFVWTAKAIDAALPGYSADHWYRILIHDPTIDPEVNLCHAKGDTLRQLRAENPEQIAPSTSGVWIAHKAAIDRLISAHLVDYRFPEEETEQLDAETEIDPKLTHVDIEEHWASGMRPPFNFDAASGAAIVNAMNKMAKAASSLPPCRLRDPKPISTTQSSDKCDIVWAGVGGAPILKVWRIETAGNPWQYEGHAQVFAWRGDSTEARDVLLNHVRKDPTQAIVACSDDPITKSIVTDAQRLALRHLADLTRGTDLNREDCLIGNAAEYHRRALGSSKFINDSATPDDASDAPRASGVSVGVWGNVDASHYVIANAARTPAWIPCAERAYLWHGDQSAVADKVLEDIRSRTAYAQNLFETKGAVRVPLITSKDSESEELIEYFNLRERAREIVAQLNEDNFSHALRAVLDVVDANKRVEPLDDDAEFMLLADDIDAITKRVESLYERTRAERDTVRARRKVLNERYEWLESLLVGLDK